MTCARCGTANEDGARFCEECGAALSEACPTCGAIVKPGARFCRSCGTALAISAAQAVSAAASPPVPLAAIAERRLVTVLFADLVGSTALADGRDPEETRELLGRYIDHARDVIARYGGTIEKFIGDAVMAVWGAPVAREDDAERAVRAALELVAGVPALHPGLQARGGVLTGEAAVTIGAVGQGMVAGDLVNTAARLQGAADPGSVWVGEATQRATRRASRTRPSGRRPSRARLCRCQPGGRCVSWPRSAAAIAPRGWRRRSWAGKRRCGCSRSCSTRPGVSSVPDSSP